MRIITTPGAPHPAGHYAQAVVHGGLVYVAGQLATDPGRPDADPGDAATQTRRAMANVGAVLEAAGSGLDRILQTTIYVTDIGHWTAVNEAYGAVMGEHRPARAIVPIGRLKGSFLLEVQVIATLRD
jgi:2-iminobutanoate/2-iminopropanoate deaminase